MPYIEWLDKVNSIESRVTLYRQLLSMPTGVVKIDVHFIEKFIEDCSTLSRLKADYPEYQI